MSNEETGRHRPSLAVAVLGSLGMIVIVLGFAATVDQFVTDHGWAVALGIIALAAFLVISLGAWRARPSTRQRVFLWSSGLCTLLALAFFIFVVTKPASARSVPSIKFTVQRNIDGCGTYLFPKPASVLAAMPQDIMGTAQWDGWARGHGGIDASDYGNGSQTRVLITIVGTTARPVTVTALRFNVVTRKPGGMTGTVVSPGCGDETIARFARVNLDKTPPAIVQSSAKVVSWDDTTERVTPLQFPYRVTNTDSESLLIMAETRNFVAWTATLDYSDGVRAGSATIDDHGKPFETSVPGPGSVQR